MSRKSKGINAEREIIKLFAETGQWSACRVAGSGSSRYPSPDVIAGNKTRKLAIECKTTIESKKYFSKEDIEQIVEFSEKFGAEPWLAVKFLNSGWYFISLDDIESTKNNFVVSLDLAKNKGLIFDELTGKF